MNNNHCALQQKLTHLVNQLYFNKNEWINKPSFSESQLKWVLLKTLKKTFYFLKIPTYLKINKPEVCGLIIHLTYTSNRHPDQ